MSAHCCSSIRLTVLTQNSWDYVWVYDVANATWFNQTTSGTAASRTEFCAVSAYDASTKSYQIYVIGGADFKRRRVVQDV